MRIQNLENEIYQRVTLTPATRAEILKLLANVAARVKALPTVKIG